MELWGLSITTQPPQHPAVPVPRDVLLGGRPLELTPVGLDFCHT